MQQMAIVRWFAKCAFSALMLLFACVMATAWFGNGLQLPSNTTRDGTAIVLNRYIREPVPAVVLVGSSLTFRLNEEYFATPSLRNLAIAGGSPVTGLEIVANGPRLPRIILVEANVLSRLVDAALVETYSRSDVAGSLFFRPIKAAIAAYEGWLHASPSHVEASTVLSRLLAEPPSDFDNRIYADRALQQFDADDPTVAVRVNVARIEQLMHSVEQKGTRLLLFELPYLGPLEESRFAKITSEIVHAKFPDPDRWLRIDFDRKELRWRDGVHLDERSSLIIARAMDKALSSLLGPL
jgi:hypothetical protein